LFGKLPELMTLGVDITQEIRLACCCYKEARINPRVMPPETGLEMATLNGANAALMAERIGSIEVGKEADIVLFDTNRPEWQPLINPVANLIYSARRFGARRVRCRKTSRRQRPTDGDRRNQPLFGNPHCGCTFWQALKAGSDGSVALAGFLMSIGGYGTSIMDVLTTSTAPITSSVDEVEFPEWSRN
jgi:hypothetical protein